MRKIKLNESSNIKAAWYDTELELLDICFHSGLTYRYIGVPQKLVSLWQQAESVGSYASKVFIGKKGARPFDHVLVGITPVELEQVI